MERMRPVCPGSGKKAENQQLRAIGFDLTCPDCDSVMWSTDPMFVPTHLVPLCPAVLDDGGARFGALRCKRQKGHGRLHLADDPNGDGDVSWESSDG